MGSKAFPAVLSSAAFPRFGPHDYSLGLVQLLRAFADCLAIVRLRTTTDVGAVSLSWNSAAYRLMVDVIASCAWISNIGISGGHRLWRHWWRGSVVRRAKVVSASCDANGAVHLRCCSRFHGAVFRGDHGIRRNFESLDRRLRSRMVGTRNGLVACSSSGMAAHQRTGGLRTTFVEMDMVVHHYRQPGSISYRRGRPQPD